MSSVDIMANFDALLLGMVQQIKEQEAKKTQIFSTHKDINSI